MKQRAMLTKVTVFVWLISFSIYTLTLVTGAINYADSDDLLLAVKFQQLAHPPGYPLLLLLLSPISNLEGEVFTYIANLSSALIGATTAALLFRLLFTLVFKANQHKHIFTPLLSSLLAVFFWVVSYRTWLHHRVLEVFPLAQLLLVGTVGLAGRNKLKQSRLSLNLRDWLVFYGATILCFHAHQLTLPFSFFLLGSLWWPLSWKQRLIQAFYWLILFLLSFVIYLPYLNQSDAVFGWGIQPSVSGLYMFVSRLVLQGGGSAIETYVGQINWFHSLYSVGIWAKLLVNEWGWLPIGLVLLGLWRVYKDNKRIALLWLGMFFIYGPLLAAYLKFPVSANAVDTEYFWGTALRLRMFFIADLLLLPVLLVGVFSVLHEYLRSKPNIIMAVVLVVAAQFSYQYHKQSQPFQYIAQFSNEVLEALPPNSVLISDSDLTFSLITQQLLFQKREDVSIIPATTGIRHTWFESQQGKLYKYLFRDKTLQLIHVIAWSLENQRPVSLLYPSEELLQPFISPNHSYWLVPQNYLLQISKDIIIESTLADSSNYMIDNNSLWYKGFLGHLATIHSMQGYFAQFHHLANYKEQEIQAKHLAQTPQTKTTIAQTFAQGNALFTSNDHLVKQILLPEEFDELIEELIETNNLNQAESLLWQALIEYPTVDDYYVSLVEVWRLQGKTEAANFLESQFNLNSFQGVGM